MKPTLRKPASRLVLAAALSALVACSDDDNNDEVLTDTDAEQNIDQEENTTDDTNIISDTGLPEGLSLSLLDTNSGAYYQFDTDSGVLTDLNEAAAASEDSAVQKLAISDTSVLGSFFHWPDFREVDGEDVFDNKYLLMTPDYVAGDTIDDSVFIQLVHFHGDTLAAHSADEFAGLEEGSAKAEGLARLNSAVAAQQALSEEVAEAMPEGETLCRAFVDPYIAYELSEEHDHEHDDADEAHEEDDDHTLIHMALSDSGRMYFMSEGEDGLSETQGFVKLDDVTSIADCDRTTIARTSEDGVLVFIPDTQMLYLVDSHGGDYHQHSSWDLDVILGEGGRADMLAVLGAGSEEEHDHDHDE
ncbi:hypothetical protein Q4485_03445 [Granulosicoccaceae sp. 1_MG-2023]|nr:hypothetical protein [Granulosicoccaceae sp. 1_MG-2023]